MADKSPERLRREIEQTRAELSSDVQTLTEKVSPGKAVGRQVRRTRDVATKAKNRIMGSDGPGGGGGLSAAASNVGDAAAAIPGATREQVRGNPLAAGLIAFGAGWLVSSILPASKAEEKLASQAKDKAAEVAKPLADHAKEAGQELVDNLKEPAQHAVDHVRSSAQDAAGEVTEHAKSAAGDVKTEAQAQHNA